MSFISTETEAPTGIRIVWGVPAIAREIGATERKVYHLVETNRLPGAKKIAGRWALRVDLFHAAFEAA